MYVDYTEESSLKNSLISYCMLDEMLPRNLSNARTVRFR